MQAAEHDTTDRSTAELKEKTDLLAKETAKTANLTTLIDTLKGHEKTLQTEAEKIKAENKLTLEKFNRMVAVHSQVFTVCILPFRTSSKLKKSLESQGADHED
jgi:hypothetical protein